MNFTEPMEAIYINSIDYREEELLEEKEKIEFLIELCDKYRNKDKRYYNLPLPEDIIYTHDNKVGYGKYNEINNLPFYEEELEFYQHVAEYYDNNDFIITSDHLYDGLFNAEQIEKYYISPEVRRRVHEICKELEESIDNLKVEMR